MPAGTAIAGTRSASWSAVTNSAADSSGISTITYSPGSRPAGQSSAAATTCTVVSGSGRPNSHTDSATTTTIRAAAVNRWAWPDMGTGLVAIGAS